MQGINFFLKRWVIFIYDTVNIYNWHNWAVTKQHGYQLQTHIQSYWWFQFNYYLESGTKLVKLISEEAEKKEDSALYSVIVSKHRLFEQEPCIVKALALLMGRRRSAELKTSLSSSTPCTQSALQSYSHDIHLPDPSTMYVTREGTRNPTCMQVKLM